jgi:hypothetical protein
MAQAAVLFLNATASPKASRAPPQEPQNREAAPLGSRSPAMQVRYHVDNASRDEGHRQEGPKGPAIVSSELLRYSEISGHRHSLAALENLFRSIT